MSFDRCSTCKGQKTVLGLGNIRKTCAVCKGVGYVKPVDNVQERLNDKLAIVQKTRGRKKKEIEDGKVENKPSETA
jgi:hypothetical protein